MSDSRITLKVSPAAYDKIKRVGKFGESINDVLIRVLDDYYKMTHKGYDGKFDGKAGKEDTQHG